MTVTYVIATEGARTRDGGIVQYASGRVPDVPHNIVRVSDLVVYPDGSAARVISGCGEAQLDRGLALAIVGSRVGNGDIIIESPCSQYTVDVPYDPVSGVSSLDDTPGKFPYLL